MSNSEISSRRRREKAISDAEKTRVSPLVVIWGLSTESSLQMSPRADLKAAIVFSMSTLCGPGVRPEVQISLKREVRVCVVQFQRPTCDVSRCLHTKGTNTHLMPRRIEERPPPDPYKPMMATHVQFVQGIALRRSIFRCQEHSSEVFTACL